MRKQIISGFVMVLCLGGGLAVAGCSTGNNTAAVAAPQFDHMQPLYVSAADVRVENLYAPGSDAHDIATSLPTPPDAALERYARNRLRPAQGVGTLLVTIENAGVYKTPIAAEGMLGRWTGAGARTKYDATARISLRKDVPDMTGGETSHTFTVTRTVTIPDSYSLARRDAALQEMVETMVEEADKAIAGTLRTQNLLVDGY